MKRWLLALLPSRASAPWHCRECDGPLDLPPGPDCSECVDAGLVQRLEWRYQNGEGVADLYVGHGIEIGREFHPLHAGFGVEFRLGSEWYVALSFGLWVLVLRRDV